MSMGRTMASLPRPALGGSGSGSGETSKSQASKSASHTRDKRHRRIRRACDDCRGRKIKCDGNSPCLSCATSNKECTYTSQQKSRYGGPMYIEELEEKVQSLDRKTRSLKSLLSVVFPDVDVEDPDLEVVVQKQLFDDNQRARLAAVKGRLSRDDDIQEKTESPEPEELLATMTDAAGRLHVDDQGHFEYTGGFGGLAFVQRIGERCIQLLDEKLEKRTTAAHAPLPIPRGQTSTSESMAFRRRMASSTFFNLPSKEDAQHLTRIALEDASSLMKFIHVPSFNHLLERIYSVAPENYSTEEESFLPLLYVTLAVGELFVANSEQKSDLNGEKIASIEDMRGVKWLRAGQAFLDTANCRDITSLQTLIFIVIYLQSSGSMHSCYSYISIAISASLQMGLHRLGTTKNLNPVESETRKQLFWVIRTMETYVTTFLGLPTILSDEDIDQELPTGVEAPDGIGSSMRPVESSSMAAANAHTKLLIIMRNMVRDTYPRAKQRSQTEQPYRVNYNRIAKVETELEEWFRKIPVPNETEHHHPTSLRTQLLLRLAYAHVQMVLYRPFVHHIVRTQLGDPPEMRSYACASACIKAAMQIVWIVEELDSRGLLISAYFFAVYITFFAVVALCMFIIGNPDDPTVYDTLRAAEKGRNILRNLAVECVSAGKCVTSLESLFEKISLLYIERRPFDDSINPVPQHGTSSTSSPAVNSPSNSDSQTKHGAKADIIRPAFSEPKTPNSLRSSFKKDSTNAFPPPPVSLPSNQSVMTFEAQQVTPSLVGMMAPPLDGFQFSDRMDMPLSSPMHGILGEEMEEPYFPYFEAGWNGQGRGSGR